jgi:hypothetical protein
VDWSDSHLMHVRGKVSSGIRMERKRILVEAARRGEDIDRTDS